VTNLAIIGGGPAGTAAAVTARQLGMTVAIWDRDRFPRDKVCGEFLSWESLPILQQEIPAVLAGAPVIRNAEFISQRNQVYAFSLPRPARGLSRRALDEALWRATISRGATGYEGEPICAVRRIPNPDDLNESVWEIEMTSRKTCLAQHLLITCGRWWALGGFPSPARNGQRRTPTEWLGAKAHFAGLAPRDVVELYFFPGGYCGLAPVENGEYNICCLLHRSLINYSGPFRLADLAHSLRTAARHASLNTRLRGAAQVSNALTTAPVCPARRLSCYQGALLAGDGAGFLDPFTGDGISMALHTGRVAAECLAEAASKNQPHITRGASDLERRYRRRVSAVRKSFWVATILRVLICAPSLIQDSAATVLSAFAPQLLRGTRWRDFPA
jgi:flavin-dependent dehydrogenase